MLSDAERRTASRLEADLLADAAFARAIRPVMSGLTSLASPVLVGVGDGGDPVAVEWAAAEAAAMGSALRLLHAVRSPVTTDVFGVVTSPSIDASEQIAAAGVLDAAVARARRVAPGVQITAFMVRGSATSVLHRESRHARLLVLGAHDPSRTGVRRLLQGSVPLRLTGAARCPVTVVHDRHRAPDGRTPSVVVGVDGGEASAATLAFAFRAARRRGAGLTAVHAWAEDRPADLEGVSAPPARSEAGAVALVERAVGPWRALYPDVPVTTVTDRRDPASALILGSAGADLVVVGSRGRGRALGVAFGSVSRAVMAGSPGPVAVVPRGALVAGALR